MTWGEREKKTCVKPQKYEETWHGQSIGKKKNKNKKQGAG
jgi:hypothetical protein